MSEVTGFDTERRVAHRISFGLETYTSLAASADGQRLIATVVNPSNSLWRLTLPSKDGALPAAPTPVLFSADGAHPRLGHDYALYVASLGGEHGIWKWRRQSSAEWGKAAWRGAKRRVRRRDRGR